MQALLPRDLTALERIVRRVCDIRQSPIKNIHTAATDRRTSIASSNRCFPNKLRASNGKFFNNPDLPPNPVPLRTKPLRPVIRQRSLIAERNDDAEE
jgi:hypothetical protein